ncbi:hypothetical protein SUNI508_07678 [Seiridium unicorne]|uniref:Transmembrane protein n=1 Tax=Seiridium unicorne TaxID=138068 RepID=A0ABR2UWE4_9PEZI
MQLGQLRQLRHRRPPYGISNAAQAGNKTTKNRFTRASGRHSTNSRDGILYGKASTPIKTVTGTSRTNHGHNNHHLNHSAGNGHPLRPPIPLPLRLPTTTANVNVVSMGGLPIIVVILGMAMIFACASGCIRPWVGRLLLYSRWFRWVCRRLWWIRLVDEEKLDKVEELEKLRATRRAAEAARKKREWEGGAGRSPEPGAKAISRIPWIIRQY